MSTPMLALESGEAKTDPNLATFGVLTLAVAVLVGFGALFGIWLSLRAGSQVWPPKGVGLENYYGTTLTATMALGVLAVEWASYAVRRGEKGQAVTGYVLVVVFGLAFINLLSYVVHVAHFGPGTHAYGAVYFAFNILMGATVLTAVVFALIALARYLGGQVSASEPAAARSAAWFWHTATVGWLVMYTAVYVVK
jgi:heme/copper-type cytochrome/quinol oxidase subunit 3